MEFTNKPIIDTVFHNLPEGECIQLLIGLHWTAALMKVQSELRCGLASTFSGDHGHGEPDVPQSGGLEKMTGLELAALAREDQLSLASIGVAAINALLQRQPDKWSDVNAEEVIAKQGFGNKLPINAQIGFVLTYLLAGIYVISILTTKKHRTPYDLAAGSCVILEGRYPENGLYNRNGVDV